jgi:hypothetical protein
MVKIGHAIYEVTDPLHPRLLCQFGGTSVHLFTGDAFTYVRTNGITTQVILHSMGSGDESVVTTFPIGMYTSWGGYLAYTPDGSYAAGMTQDNPDADLRVWLATQGGARQIRTFPLPIDDCVCRFGLTLPTLSFSPDGQYIVSGWPIGRGGSLSPLEVQRVADQAVVKILDASNSQAIWGRMGHTLYVTGDQFVGKTSSVWTPESGLVALPGAVTWQYQPGLAPDGADVAYTAFTNFPDGTSIRVFVYDFASKKTSLLINQPRSEATFVKDGWVWYLEEQPCATCAGGSEPTSKVFAMNLSTGVEATVVFAAGESPELLQSGWDAGEFWPNS